MKPYLAFPFAAVATALIATSAPVDAGMPIAGAAIAVDTPTPVALKKKPKKSEADRSVDNGTVPARYRSRVPREYQQYIPFEKGR